MFTQDDVNRIVSERLAREREKLSQQNQIDEREQALTEREQALEAKEARFIKSAAVREYYRQKGIEGKRLDIAMKGSGSEIDALEIENEQIKDYAPIDELISGVFSGLVGIKKVEGAPTTDPPANIVGSSDRRIADAFKPEI